MFRKAAFYPFYITLLCLCIFFVHNRIIYPDIMESRNLVTAREMVQYENWLVPTMNGELRLEKPPLPTWIAAVVENFSPDNLFLQRAMAGLAATLLVLLVYFFGLQLTRQPLYALMAALVLCTCVSVILMARTATWDIYCHSFMMVAIYFLFRAFQKPGPQWLYLLGAGLAMGLSFLSKGPVSFYALLLPFLLVYFPLYRPSFRSKGMPLLLMIVLCLVLSLWWPAYLYLSHRELFLQVIAKESGAWMNHSVRPWYYYWKFFLESGVWSLFLLTALCWFYWKKRFVLKKEYLLTVYWTLAVLILLSLLPEKKTRYLFPVLIPATMTIAHLLFYLRNKKNRYALTRTEKISYRLNTGFIAFLTFLLPVAAYILFYNRGTMAFSAFLLSTLLIWGIGIYMLLLTWKIHPFSFLGSVVVLLLVVELTLLPPMSGLFNHTMRKSIHVVRDMEELRDIPFYYPSGEELRIELVYEAGRRILPLNCRHDSLVMTKLPCVLVSADRAEKLLSLRLQQKIGMELIDKYDDNRRPPHTSWYSSKFVRYVTRLSRVNEWDDQRIFSSNASFVPAEEREKEKYFPLLE